MAEVNDRLIIELEAKVDKLAAGIAAGNRQIQTFARQAEKDLTDLQLKLEIARARGDKKAAEGLADQIQLMQTKSKLMRRGLEETEAQAQAEAHLAAVIKARHEAEAGGVGVALDKVFDSSKLAVIEEGSAKLRVFGSAIEPLGGLGIAAAVGVVALAEAAEQVKKATEEVGQIGVRAERLGVGVEALQALDFAAKESHVTTEQLDESIKGLQESLGKLRQGVGDKRLVPEAQLLGLGPEELARAKDVAEFLPELIERINNLPTIGEKVNAAQKFGIEPLLPLILKGKEGVAELEEEFKRLGITVSTQTARQIEEGNLALERADTIAHDKIRNSLLDLQPILVKAGTWWDDLKVHAVDAFVVMTEAAAKFPQLLALGEKGSQAPNLGPQAPGAAAKAAAAGSGPSGPTAKQIADQAEASKKLEDLQARLLDHATHRHEVEKQIAEIEAKQGHALDAQLKARLLSAASAEDAAPGQRKADAAARKALESAKTGQGAIDEAADALIAARKQELQAQLSATKDEDERAALQAAIKQLDSEHAQALLERKTHDLESKVKLGEISRADADAAIADLKAAKSAQDRAAAYGEAAATAQRLGQSAAETARLIELGLEGQAQRLQIEAALTKTRKERADLERQILELTYQEQKTKLEQVINDKNNVYTGAQKREAQAQLDNLNQLHPLQLRQIDQNSAGPLDQYLDSFNKLNDEIEQDGVTAIHDLSTGLVNAALHAKNLGQVAEEVFLNLVDKVLSQILEQEAAPGLVAGVKTLLAFIPGFAGGTKSTPSGPIIVGEDGPEILNPGPGNTIIPNSAIRAASAARPVGSGGVYAPVYNDLRGAIVQEDLYDRINRASVAAAAQGAQRGRALAVQDIQRAGYMGNLNQ